MIFKSTCTSFISWWIIFFRAIEYVWDWDIGGIVQAEFLEEAVKNLEKEVSEWNQLKQQDLTPLVEAKLERLAEQTNKNYLETS